MYVTCVFIKIKANENRSIRTYIIDGSNNSCIDDQYHAIFQLRICMYQEFELNNDFNPIEEKKFWHLYCTCKAIVYHDDEDHSDVNNGHYDDNDDSGVVDF